MSAPGSGDLGAPAGDRFRATLSRGLTLVALLGFGLLLREALTLVAGNATRATIAVGFLLLSAVVAGRLASGFGLPRITGYILIGLLVGPEVLGIVSAEDVAGLKLIDDIAISLIALSAGGELRMSMLRDRGRSMGGIMVAEMVLVFVVIGGGVLLVADLLPITQGRPFSTVLVIALVFGSIAIANSPSVAIAVINDTASDGPVSSTILGVTVLKDVAVILLFAIALAVARTALGSGTGFESEFFLGLGMEIGGSILAGVISGVIIAALLRTVQAHVVLFALAIAFVNAYVAQLLHLEVLLLSLVAGFFLENISPVHGDPFVHALERNALPVYALFFALAGAGLHLGELATLWPFVAAFVVARAAAVFAGTWIGARVTGAEPEVRRYAWLGFISQAGVTLGMVVIAARSFPEWGAELQTLFVTMVAIHELIGPVLLQKGLEKAGEVGKRDRRAAERAAAPAGSEPPGGGGAHRATGDGDPSPAPAGGG